MEDNESFYFGEDQQEEVIPQEGESIFGSSYEDDGTESTGDGDGSGEEYTDYIDTVLQAKGIDRNGIEITDEDGTTSTVSWDDLSDEDKAAILSGEAPVEENDQEPVIADNELDMLNYFRQNHIGSLQEFADAIAHKAVEDYIASQPAQNTTDIDSYSDDEIIALDYINRFGENMSDEEIDEEIERLKTNEEAYKKRVQLLRDSFKAEEEAQRKLYEDTEKQKSEENQQAFVTAYNSAAHDLNTIQGIDLNDEDKAEILDYVLTKDQFNRTQFSKDLDDPEKVLRMAWFMKHGEYAAEATRNYFAQLLAKQRSASQPAKGGKAVTRPRVAAATKPQAKQTSAFKW